MPGTGPPDSLPLNYWPNGEVKAAGEDFLWRSLWFGSFKKLVIYVFALVWRKFFNIQFKIQHINMVWSLFSISIRRWKYLILSQININIFIFIWPSNKQTEKPILWFWAKISMLSFFSSVVLVFTFAFYLVLCNRLIRYGRTSRIISAAILCMLLSLLKALRKLVPVFSSFCELRVQVPFFLLFQPQLSSEFVPVRETQHSQGFKAFCGACFPHT